MRYARQAEAFRASSSSPSTTFLISPEPLKGLVKHFCRNFTAAAWVNARTGPGPSKPSVTAGQKEKKNTEYLKNVSWLARSLTVIRAYGKTDFNYYTCCCSVTETPPKISNFLALYFLNFHKLLGACFLLRSYVLEEISLVYTSSLGLKSKCSCSDTGNKIKTIGQEYLKMV